MANKRVSRAKHSVELLRRVPQYVCIARRIYRRVDRLLPPLETQSRTADHNDIDVAALSRLGARAGAEQEYLLNLKCTPDLPSDIPSIPEQRVIVAVIHHLSTNDSPPHRTPQEHEGAEHGLSMRLKIAALLVGKLRFGVMERAVAAAVARKPLVALLRKRRRRAGGTTPRPASSCLPIPLPSAIVCVLQCSRIRERVTKKRVSGARHSREVG